VQALGDACTRSDLAKAAGTSPANVSRYLSGARPMPLSFLLAAARHLHLNGHWLLFGEGPMRGGEIDWTSVTDLDLEIQKARLEIEQLRMRYAPPQGAGAGEAEAAQRVRKLEELIGLYRQLEQMARAASAGERAPPPAQADAGELRRTFAREARRELREALDVSGVEAEPFHVARLAEPSFRICDVEQLPKDWPERYVPIIGRLAAGIDLAAPEGPTSAAAAAYRYLQFQGAPATAFALEIQGDSMLPTYHHGDMVIVDASTRVSAGVCAVVTRRDGERIARLKRLRIAGRTAVLESLNPKYKPIRLPASRVEAYAVWKHLPFLRVRPAGQ
jgi:SOS-response transcriptional repressor LexA